MAGKIQNEDIKSAAELVTAGGTAAQLPNDDKVWVTASGINKTLKQAIIDGDIGGGGALASSAFAISYTAASLLTNNTDPVLYDTMVFDNTGGAYNPLTGEFTAPSNDFYLVGWTGTSVARQSKYDIQISGSSVTGALYTVGATAAAQGYALVYLTSGQALRVVNSTGTNEQLTANQADNRFQVIRIGGGTVGNWATYTPSNTQGFGSITPKLIKWRQVGQNYEVEATIETGSVSPSEAQFELPNGAVSSSTLLSTNPGGAGTADVVGSLIRNAPTGAFDTTVLCEPGKTYVTFGVSNGSSGGLTKVVANAMVGSSETITIRFSVPI